MRVLHVTSTLPRAEGDGTPGFILDLAVACREAGIDTTLLAPHAAGLSDHGTLAGIPVHRFRYAPARLETLAHRGGLLASARSPRAVLVPPFVAGMAGATRIQGRDADLIHAHWWAAAGVAAAVSGRPYVVTLHGSDVAIAQRRPVQRLAAAVLRRARAVLAVSDALAAEAASLFGISVEVARMPVVVPPPDPSRPRAGLLAVGRLVPEKGFDVLIEAVRATGVAVDILGDGPLRASLGAQAAGLPVRFHGFSRPDYVSRLAAARALVVPSRREGLGLVAVEAILLGTPVIATAVGGLPGVLGASAGDRGPVPGGILVDGVADLAVALTADLPPPSGRAVEEARRHLPPVVAARHREIYERVLSIS